MKKTLKVLLCAALVLSMVFSFAGCADDEPIVTPPVEESNNSEDSAKTAVETVMNDVLEYDVDAIEEKLAIDCTSKEELMAKAGEEIGEAAELYGPIIEKMFDKYVDSFEYEIVEFGKDDGVYTAEVEFTCLDMESVSEGLAATEGDAIGEELMMEMLADGRITMDMSEEEMMAVVMEEIAPVIEEMVDEAVKGADTKTLYLDFVVVEEDGEWVIDIDESSYDDLREELESIDE